MASISGWVTRYDASSVARGPAVLYMSCALSYNILSLDFLRLWGV